MLGRITKLQTTCVKKNWQSIMYIFINEEGIILLTLKITKQVLNFCIYLIQLYIQIKWTPQYFLNDKEQKEEVLKCKSLIKLH